VSYGPKSAQGDFVPLNAPAGGGGPGPFTTPKHSRSIAYYGSQVPDPDSPAGRHHHLTHDDKKHLHARSHVHPLRGVRSTDIVPVLHAIVSVLEGGVIPNNVPERYQVTLQQLSDARVDRTTDRLLIFENAMGALGPVLAAAEVQFRGLKKSIKVDIRIGQWRYALSGGPVKVPQPYYREKFEYVITAAGGETIEEIARALGWEDPSPLFRVAYGYTANMRLARDDQIYVPWPSAKLKDRIEISESLVEQSETEITNIENAMNDSLERYENAMFVLEAVCIFRGIYKGGMKLAMYCEKHFVRKVLADFAKSKFPNTYLVLKLTAEEEFEHELKHHATHAAKEIVGVATGRLTKSHSTLNLLARHGFAWVNPVGYAVEIGLAIQQGNIKIWFYGPEAVIEDNIGKLKRAFEPRRLELESAIDLMKFQLMSPLYNQKNEHQPHKI
jgi:hypothetical protein